MVVESNKGSSTLHFTWFNPRCYVATTRNILGPFQGAQADIEGRLVVPITGTGPLDERAHITDVGLGPTNPTKKPKTSKISNNTTPISSNTKQPKSKKVKPSSSSKHERMSSNVAIPSAICTCTGVARQCSRWGSGGWQSLCCTSSISEYPLPMSSTKPGLRVPGRKMSNGAFEKLLQRLIAQGYDLSCPIDLKSHWAKHGSNKFMIKK